MRGVAMRCCDWGETCGRNHSQQQQHRSEFSTIPLVAIFREPAPAPAPEAEPEVESTDDWDHLQTVRAMTFSKEPKTLKSMKADCEADATADFMISLPRYFNNPEWADVTIILGEVKVVAHRLVLGIQSPHFAKALEEGFAEATTKQLTCPPGKEHSYLRMLQYMYTGTYEDETSEILPAEGNRICHRGFADVITPDDPELLIHARVYFLADCYEIDGLKTVALEKFRQQLDALWASDGFIDCIEEVYENTRDTDLQIREEIVCTIKAHIHILQPRKRFRALLHQGGDLAIEIVRALSSDRPLC